MIGSRRLSVLNSLIPFIKLIAIVLFMFISAYVMLCGKGKTGINVDYACTAIMLVGVLVIL